MKSTASLDGLRSIKMVSDPKNVHTVLSIDIFYNRYVFLPKLVTDLYVTFIDIYACFSKNVALFVFRILVSDRQMYTNDFNMSRREY